MIRFGLCCLFKEIDIKFRTTTARHLKTLSNEKRIEKLSYLCLHNAVSLKETLSHLFKSGILAFRINSQILPLKTHPEVGYELEDFPDGLKIIETFKEAGDFAKKNNIRISFHPDQFVVLNSPKPLVVKNSLQEIEYQCQVARWVNADVINIHGGGGYGDKPNAIKRFQTNFNYLSEAAKKILTIENDDRVYTPEELFPLCEKLRIPLVYDVHHHRCLEDNLTLEEATRMSIDTWNREPLFHISSPINGWKGKYPNRHHDYIDFNDFPSCWSNLSITVEVEAKAKELAVLKLKEEYEKRIKNHVKKN